MKSAKQVNYSLKTESVCAAGSSASQVRRVQNGSGMRSTKQEGREEEESGGEVHLYTGVWPS